MIADIRKLLDERPFRPFQVITSAGREYHVPSPEHAGFNPRGTRVLIWFDDDSSVDISALHISAIEKDKPRENRTNDSH